MTLSDEQERSDPSTEVPLEEAPVVTASGVIAVLRKRWPETEYVLVEEAPDSADRMGKKIDLLAMSCWRSRGYQLDAVEVKVSMSDWKRELANAGKADFWWRHSHRFWIAAPEKIAPKILPELPPTWGLMSVTANSVKDLRKADTRKPEPLPWGTTLGCLRATQAASTRGGILAQRREDGYRQGLEEGLRRAGESAIRRQLEELQTTMKRFEEASGLEILEHPWNAGPIGKAVKFVMNVRPEDTLRAIEHLRDRLDVAAKEFRG